MDSAFVGALVELGVELRGICLSFVAQEFFLGEYISLGCVGSTLAVPR